MKLPEPARTTWRQHREMLHKHARRETPPTRVMLGGGTILAARLNHRRSSDIDMFLPDIDSIDNWKPGGSLDLVKATGGKLEGLRKNRIIVRVTPESSLDVAAVRPKLPDTETKEDIDERTETTLTNVQIILGKLYRTEQIVTRDAFDIVSAAKGDPRALEIAVNTLNSDELRVVRGNLFAGNDNMAREAGDVLKGITPEYETDLRNLGRNASVATNTHRYQRVRIQAENGRLNVQTTTKTRGTVDEDHDGKLVRSGLQRTGIDQYMAANAAISSRKALDDLNVIAESGWTGLVFDSSDREAHSRMEAALRDALEYSGRNGGTNGNDDDGPGGANPSNSSQGNDNPPKDNGNSEATSRAKLSSRSSRSLRGQEKTRRPIIGWGEGRPAGGGKPNVQERTTRTRTDRQ